MDKTQADTVADSLMEPGRQAQESNRQRRQAKEKAEATERRYRWPHLLGLLIGAAVTYIAGRIFGFAEITSYSGILMLVAGAITGSALARLVVAVRFYRARD